MDAVIGDRTIFGIFETLPDCNLKAMCDVNETRLKHLKALYPEVEGMTSYDHMLNGIGLDAVVIATSVKHHLLPGQGEPAGRQAHAY